MSHICPAPHCSEDVPDHMLMCKPHWFKVPVQIRSRVWRAWKKLQSALPADREQASSEHGQAIHAAIESLRTGGPS